jgi:hypothetical protein
MAWDNEDWLRRVKLAKTAAELKALAMEIPDDLPLRVPDDPVLISMGLATPSSNSTSTTRTEKIPDG